MCHALNNFRLQGQRSGSTRTGLDVTTNDTVKNIIVNIKFKINLVTWDLEHAYCIRMQRALPTHKYFSSSAREESAILILEEWKSWLRRCHSCHTLELPWEIQFYQNTLKGNAKKIRIIFIRKVHYEEPNSTLSLGLFWL